MIISHKYRCIYIRSVKTGSTTIEDYFRHNSCMDDIMTWDRFEGWDSVNIDKKFSPHATALAIKNAFPKEWNSYYIFTSERNPWETAFSLYKFRRMAVLKDSGAKPENFAFERSNSFQDFILCNRFMPNHQYWQISGEIVANVILYENFYDDFTDVLKKIGAPIPAKLPRKKSGYGPSQNYQQFYNQEMKEMVENACAPTIKHFRYGF